MGGGGKGGSAPAMPDFNGLADKQIAANRYNDQGPFASTSWGRSGGGSAGGGAGGGTVPVWNGSGFTQTPSPGSGSVGSGGLGGFGGAMLGMFGGGTGTGSGSGGQWTRSANLDPTLQGAAGNVMDQFAAGTGAGPITGDAARRQAIDANMGQFTSRLDPQWSQNEEALTSQLASQGLDPGSEAYDKARGNFDRARTDAYQTAENAAVQQGNQAQAITYGENLSSRELPLQEMAGLKNLTAPSGGQAAQADYLGPAMAAYNGALQNYGIQQQGKNSKLGGASSLGGAGILANAMGPAAPAVVAL